MGSTEIFISATHVDRPGSDAKADLTVRVHVQVHGCSGQEQHQRPVTRGHGGGTKVGLGHGSRRGNRVGVTGRLRDGEGTRGDQGNKTRAHWHLP